ncbi:hypothetical protein ACQVP2_28265 [Methylobacterium aquaticum]|uniref:hypothetical protein n=1 Tax=Methylobacterium aquaticum TaxID=270351 RepID=UPI003D177AA8
MTDTTTDVPEAERIARRHRLNARAAREREKNLTRGLLKRGPHSQSLARTRPWEAMGISQNAWKQRHRRGEPGYVRPPIPEPAAQPSDTSGIERALDLALAALLDHRARQERQHQGLDLHPAPFRLGKTGEMPRRAESALVALLRDPVEHALGTALSDLGRHLFSLTGTVEGMRQVCDRVAGLDPARASCRVSILDAAWNGIGRGDERWRT